jgi:AcrR family transcriptional regulator
MAEKTAPDPAPRAQRADAQRNYQRILDVARTVVAEQGTHASLREIARRTGIGLGTFYRHFPTRDALLEALLRERFEVLTAAARSLGDTHPPDRALKDWLREFLAGSTSYRGLAASMMATLGDEGSPLHASCLAMRESVAGLLERAQDAGHVRPDVDRLDLFALMASIGWITEQAPSLADRSEHLFSLIMDAIAYRPTPNIRPPADP